MKNKRFRYVVLLLSVFCTFLFVSCSLLKEKDDSDGNTTTDNSTDNDDTSNVDKSELVTCRLFYFDTTQAKLFYVDKDLSIANDNLAQALNDALKSNQGDSALVNITNEPELESVNLDKDSGVLTVKFKNNFIGQMNLGDIPETGFYSALIDTYAFNYNVTKVAVYQNGEIYSGLRGDLPEGYNTVSYTDVKPLSEKVAEPTTVQKDVRIFYYDGDADKLYYKDQTVEVIDKAVVSALTNALKNPIDSKFGSIDKDVSVVWAKVDEENHTITVNLSPEYYNILTKVGSSSEAGMLDSLAYTYGYNYNVSKVIILVDGKNYSGSHIAFEDGQSLQLDYSTVTEVQN